MLLGANMNRRKTIVFGAMLFVAGAGSLPASAQTFQNYRCADGTQFIVGFFEYDKRAHLQIDGRAVTLGKRFALSGSRYSGGGVTLKITNAGSTIKHTRRPATACELT
jgi:membrane-bound inhibitor of C-type lysozyme